MRENSYEQRVCLRRHFLPAQTDHDDEPPDSAVNLGRAAWLAEWLYEQNVNATAEGVAFALTGKRSS
ncbi:TPA: hypothetical protein I4D82_08840 [Enterobacter cloacae]|nr:hypothetical protein [Enterobacter cloacae]